MKGITNNNLSLHVNAEGRYARLILFICLPVRLPAWIFIWLSACLPFCLFTNSIVSLNTYLAKRLTARLHVCLPVHTPAYRLPAVRTLGYSLFYGYMIIPV